MPAKDPHLRVNAVQCLPVDAYWKASRVEMGTEARGWWIQVGSGRVANIAKKHFYHPRMSLRASRGITANRPVANTA
jgi:hypothetical protein